MQGYDGRHVRLAGQQRRSLDQTGGAESRESAAETADPGQAAAGRYELVQTTRLVEESGLKPGGFKQPGGQVQANRVPP